MSSMAVRSDRKLNRLQRDLPEGLLADAAWLEAHGYSRSLRGHYLRAGWLEKPAPRVYRRSRAPLTWEQVVVSLQHLLELPLTIGGRTALEQLGYAHYLPVRAREIQLYGPKRPPTWLADVPVDVAFAWRNSLRLFPSDADLPPIPSPMLVSAVGTTLSIRYSSKERAVLELLDELPNRESFDQVDALMEGLSDLSPNRLQWLLERCASVKVKRLFLFFADRHQHAWLSELDRLKIDLGSGNRMLVKGGRLDHRYRITVPSEFAAN